jgi:AraC family transcriptional regulator, ethanolamine operon transcriptional activator
VPTLKHHRQIVQRFDAIVRADVGKGQRIPEICQVLAVSQRTLARAVRAVHGVTPVHRRRALALAAARRALLDGARGNVRQVALRFGFHEVGRFAADYRAAFGENPSQTLRGNSVADNKSDRSSECCAQIPHGGINRSHP